MLQVRENEISLRSTYGGPEYLRTQREHCWRCTVCAHCTSNKNQHAM